MSKTNSKTGNRSFIAWMIFLVLTMALCSVYAIANAQTQCKGITVKGVRCAKRADSTGYCYWHHPNKANQCTALTKKGERCKKIAVKGSTVCSVHQMKYHQYD